MHKQRHQLGLEPGRRGQPGFGWSLVAGFLLGLSGVGQADGPVLVEPYEMAGGPPATEVDRLTEKRLVQAGIGVGPVCSDAVFLRRATLDLTGTLPEVAEVRAFLADRGPDKRLAVIDKLLASPAHADYMAMRWGDVLRIKAEFPINLWPNAVQAYSRWVHEAMLSNLPHDRFARQLLTSSGSNFRVPQVNFLRAVQGRDPSGLAAATALTFLGSRIDRWPAERRAGLEKFFTRVSYKATAEWKEEIVCLDPAPAGPIDAMLPDGRAGRVDAGRDPREVLANWLVAPDNLWFARATVNRLWSWLMGRGIIHEPDDIRPDNPAANPELLDHLAKEFIAGGYDRRKLLRTIMASRTYQRSSIAREPGGEAEALFAFYPVRRLAAEVLVDVLCDLTGTSESYVSPVPEPFTYLPDTQRAVSLGDGSIGSSFLEMFGRPSRDTGLEAERNLAPSDGQRLHLLNSTHVQNKLRNGMKMRRLLEQGRDQAGGVVATLYLAILSRPPTAAEASVAAEYMRAGSQGSQGNQPNQPNQQKFQKNQQGQPKFQKNQKFQSFQKNQSYQKTGVEDLVWALVNSKEFLYHH